MTGQTERVILIKGDSTKWYNQAIFIVNQDTPKNEMPVNFVAEAEKIINNYMTHKKAAPPLAVGGGSLATAPVSVAPLARPPVKTTKLPNKKGSKVDFVLNALMLLACMTIVAVLVYGMLG